MAIALVMLRFSFSAQFFEEKDGKCKLCNHQQIFMLNIIHFNRTNIAKKCNFHHGIFHCIMQHQVIIISRWIFLLYCCFVAWLVIIHEVKGWGLAG